MEEEEAFHPRTRVVRTASRTRRTIGHTVTQVSLTEANNADLVEITGFLRSTADAGTAEVLLGHVFGLAWIGRTTGGNKEELAVTYPTRKRAVRPLGVL